MKTKIVNSNKSIDTTLNINSTSKYWSQKSLLRLDIRNIENRIFCNSAAITFCIIWSRERSKRNLLALLGMIYIIQHPNLNHEDYVKSP